MSNHEKRIRSTTKFIVASIISILLITFVGFEYLQWQFNPHGIIILVIASFMYCGFLLLFLPSAQKLETTEKTISFNSYKRSRCFRWEEIHNVSIEKKKSKSGTEERVVLDIIENFYTRKQNNSIKIYPFSVKAEAYGYNPKELEEIIRNKIIQQNVQADKYHSR